MTGFCLDCACRAAISPHPKRERSGLLSSGYLWLRDFADCQERDGASSREPGASYDQQEASDGGESEVLLEYCHAQEHRDGRIDIGNDRATTGSDFGNEREEDWQGQGRADYTEDEQAR